MTTCGEVMDKLKEYFLKQDKEEVCIALASALLDFYMIATVNPLHDREADELKDRILKNAHQLTKFMNDPAELEKPFKAVYKVDKCDP